MIGRVSRSSFTPIETRCYHQYWGLRSGYLDLRSGTIALVSFAYTLTFVGFNQPAITITS